MQLHRTDTPFNRDERNKQNENWEAIEQGYNNVVETVSIKAFNEVVNAAKLNWQNPVDTYEDITPTYPNPEEGWAVMARKDSSDYPTGPDDERRAGTVWRYTGTEWKAIQQIDPTVINEVDTRLTEQLDQAKIDENGFVYPSVKDRLDTEHEEVTTQLAQETNNIESSSVVFKKMNTSPTSTLGNQLTICCWGNSLTAGNGASEGGDWPTRLKEYLNQISRSGQTINIINRGVGGDNTKMSDERWPTPSGADITILFLGTNDYDHVRSMEEFTYHYENIMKRELNNGTSLVLVTAPQWGSKDWMVKPSNGSLQDYNEVIKGLGRKYNAPVLDLFAETRNLDASAYKDGEGVPKIHYNDVGYQMVSQKIAAMIGFQAPTTINPLKNGGFLGVRPAVDGIKFQGNYYYLDDQVRYPTPGETNVGRGLGVQTADTELVFYYGVYVEEDNLAIIPSFKFTAIDGTEKLEVSINNNSMPINYNNSLMYYTDVTRGYPTSRLNLTNANFPNGFALPNVTQNFYKSPANAKYLIFPTKGYYTIKVSMKYCEFHGFDLVSANTMMLMRSRTDTGWVPFTVQNGAVKQGSASLENVYRIERRGNLNEVTVRLNLTGVQVGVTFAQLPSNVADGIVKHFWLNDSNKPIRVAVGATGAIATGATPTSTLIGEFSYKI
ncbi:SGNH/GDSL hydrolase family protein [Ornithinibacillus xuwenensis]|uniref:SGNH/GDSL hydrolase family protein n=1 Tax=Ornithinibacillus xuwenensis TaxID=3144668 RepID=A0ABU9XBR0_9BACI